MANKTIGQLSRVFRPNAILSLQAVRVLVGFEIGLVAILWFTSPSVLLPKPGEVLSALGDLWRQGLGYELAISFLLNLEAIFVATVLSLLLAYSTVMPFFRPMVTFVGKLRFLPLIGLTYLFTLMTTSGHQLKLSLLSFVVIVFFVTSMADVIRSIPKENFDLARTLQMGEWRVVWEVIILGRIDQVFDVLRQNAAMSWAFLTFAESIARSGGIGNMLTDQDRHFRIAGIFAIQLVMLSMGLLQDVAIGGLKRIFCPYAFLTLERHS